VVRRRSSSRAGLQHLHGRIFTVSPEDGKRLRAVRGFHGTRKDGLRPLALKKSGEVTVGGSRVQDYASVGSIAKPALSSQHAFASYFPVEAHSVPRAKGQDVAAGLHSRVSSVLSPAGLMPSHQAVGR
jgi:hypothetical protein